MIRLFRLPVLALLLAICAPSTLLRAEERLDLFLRGFDEMAQWHDNRTPVPVRKWQRTLRVRIAGPMSSTYDGLVMDHLNKMADLAGLAVQRTAASATDENFLVQFDESSG